MDVKLPKLGEGAESGTVVNVLVNEGDTVTLGQTLMELENEKAVAPIPSPAAGVIQKIRVKVGDRITIGQVILTVSDAAGSAPAAAAKTPAPKAGSSSLRSPQRRPAPPVAPESESGAEAELDSPEFEDDGTSPVVSEGIASPSIRRMARELGIDLTRISGSERGGRIVIEDLRAYIHRLQRTSARASGAGAAKGAAAAPPPPSIDFSKWGPVIRKPMTSLRQTISRRMLENWTTIPHVTQFDDADLTAISSLRKSYAGAYEKRGVKLTLTPLILRAVVVTLQKHPIFNCSLDEATNEIVFKEYYHLGLAVDTDQGLIVPVIRDVERKTILQLAQEVNELAAKARDRKVSLAELQGGTFTISNQGGIGGAHFTPIVNKPEVAILGLGQGRLRPAVVEKKIEPRLLLPLGLSYDHRAIDGGAAARFVTDLVAQIEQFPEDILKL